MNGLSFSLLKYLTLFAAVCIATANLFYNIPGGPSFFFLELVFGLLYFGFSMIEFARNLGRIDPSYERFFYLPFKIVTLKFIKLGAFTVAGVVLYLSRSNLIVLAGLIFLLVFTDMLVFSLRLQKKDYFISLFANYIFFAGEEERKLFASQVDVVEYRYKIFYIKLKKGGVASIDTSRIAKGKRNAFTEKFVLWVVCNNLHFTDEAREKLADIIADAI